MTGYCLMTPLTRCLLDGRVFCMSIETTLSDILFKADEPVWLKKLREEAYAMLQNAPFLNGEPWRKIPLRNFDPGKYTSFAESYTSEETKTDKLTIKKLADLDSDDQKYIVERYTDLLKKYASDYFVLYALAYFTEGMFVSIADNFAMNEAVELTYRLKTNANYFAPLTFIRTGKFSKLNLIENTATEYNSNMDLGLLAAFTDLKVAESANIFYTAIEDFSKDLYHFRTVNTVQEANSNLTGLHFHTGGNRGKTFYITDVIGKGAHLQLNGLAEMSGREFNDVEMKVNHLEGDSESSINYKTILSGKAHNVFTGNLYIPKKLKHAKASQVSNNLLLDKSARAEAIPALEVYAEDIRCTHGATVGELDKELIFYLNSRGLDEKEARSVIVGAFISSILEIHPSVGSVNVIKEILKGKGYSL